jgi:charged multivesicular body protein 1
MIVQHRFPTRGLRCPASCKTRKPSAWLSPAWRSATSRPAKQPQGVAEIGHKRQVRGNGISAINDWFALYPQKRGQLRTEGIFQLRFTARQLEAQAKRNARGERKEKLKVKRAIRQGDAEAARLYAQSAIRERRAALDCLRLAARVGGAATQAEQALRLQAVGAALADVTKAVGVAAKKMDIQQLTMTMDKFDKQLEDLNVATEYVGQTVDRAATSITPADEVDRLIEQVADEYKLELTDQMVAVPSRAAVVVAPPAKMTAAQ